MPLSQTKRHLSPWLFSLRSQSFRHREPTKMRWGVFPWAWELWGCRKRRWLNPDPNCPRTRCVFRRHFFLHLPPSCGPWPVICFLAQRDGWGVHWWSLEPVHASLTQVWEFEMMMLCEQEQSLCWVNASQLGCGSQHEWFCNRWDCKASVRDSGKFWVWGSSQALHACMQALYHWATFSGFFYFFCKFKFLFLRLPHGHIYSISPCLPCSLTPLKSPSPSQIHGFILDYHCCMHIDTVSLSHTHIYAQPAESI